MFLIFNPCLFSSASLLFFVGIQKCALPSSLKFPLNLFATDFIAGIFDPIAPNKILDLSIRKKYPTKSAISPQIK